MATIISLIFYILVVSPLWSFSHNYLLNIAVSIIAIYPTAKLRKYLYRTIYKDNKHD